MASAQAAGGQVKRPSSTSQQRTGNRSRQPSDSSKRVMTQAERNRILSNLINNMVLVEGGTFMMGASELDTDAWDEDRPIHSVTLSSFSIGKYEVTQEEWLAVMGHNPSINDGAKFPVENIEWGDCQTFIRKLNTLTGKLFRLPTEAEWEYAARGGNKSRGYKYAGSNDIGSVAWLGMNSGHSTHQVGQKQPNELGLFDMSGNVWEWCQDWYGKYSSSKLINPIGPSSGSHHVTRGGSRDSSSRGCRVACHSFNPNARSFEIGFRLVLQ